MSAPDGMCRLDVRPCSSSSGLRRLRARRVAVRWAQWHSDRLRVHVPPRSSDVVIDRVLLLQLRPRKTTLRLDSLLPMQKPCDTLSSVLGALAPPDAVDQTCYVEKPTNCEEICEMIMRRSETDLNGFLGYRDEPLASAVLGPEVSAVEVTSIASTAAARTGVVERASVECGVGAEAVMCNSASAPLVGSEDGPRAGSLPSAGEGGMPREHMLKCDAVLRACEIGDGDSHRLVDLSDSVDDTVNELNSLAALTWALAAPCCLEATAVRTMEREQRAQDPRSFYKTAQTANLSSVAQLRSRSFRELFGPNAQKCLTCERPVLETDGTLDFCEYCDHHVRPTLDKQSLSRLRACEKNHGE